MKETRERILDKSLELFNEKGTDSVTVREIAAAIGISHGNLCYHFPNTDTIVYFLYQRLVQDLNVVIAPTQTVELDLKMFIEMGERIINLLYDYRFLMSDFVRVMRRNDQIRGHFQELVTQRKVQFKFGIEALVRAGYFKEEVIPGQYDKLVEVNQILGDFWVASAEILYSGNRENRVKHYLEIMTAHFIPCLTEKGIKQYLEFFGKK